MGKSDRIGMLDGDAELVGLTQAVVVDIAGWRRNCVLARLAEPV